MKRYLTKGKYAGHTIEELKEKNPAYLLWAIQNKVQYVIHHLTTSEINKLKEGEDNVTRFKVTCIHKGTDSDTKNTKIQFKIYGINKSDCYAIINKLNSNKSLYTNTCQYLMNALVITIFKENFDKWCETGLSALQSILYNTNDYDVDDIEHLEDEIYAKFGNAFTSQDKVNDYKQNKQKAIDIWKDYLKRLDDPEVRKQIEMFSALPIGNKKYGHLLSTKNAMLIRATNQNASFILPISWWRKLNRGVKKGAKRYVIYIPVDGTNASDLKLISDVIEEMGWGKTPYDELPPQVRREVDIKTNNLSANAFRPVYEYDYSDTYLFKGAEDIFNNTVGLRNNLTGELNQLAKDDIAKTSNIKVDEIMANRTKKANDFMVEFCNKNNIKFNASDNISINLVNALKSKYSQDARDIDILRDVNIKQFSENATHITLLMGKYAYDALSLFTHGYEYTNKEVSEMINVVSSTISLINYNMQMNESKNMLNEDFVNDFMKVFKKIGCKIIPDKQKQYNESKIDTIINETIQNAVKKKISMK